MAQPLIRAYLDGGNVHDRRSIGRADELVRLLQRRPRLLPQLIREMWNPNPVIAMRAADAVEKLTRTNATPLQKFKNELCGLAEETAQQELRWHLAAMIPRLQLSWAEHRRFYRVLTHYLQDKSSIVKTFALQGLFDLSAGNPALRPEVEEFLRSALKTGTAAMKARSRRLLSRMAKSG